MAKWQPVVLVKEDRLECSCGALAIFVCLEERLGEDGEKTFDYTAWCQECFSQAQMDRGDE